MEDTAMTQDDFIQECTPEGPGLDGYAYRADTYCVTCGEKIVREIAPKVAPTLEGTDDPSFLDTEVVPCPIFFGESPDCEQHCGDCGEYLYGEDPELEEVDDD